ncbi:hypothetical protein N7492_008553 [Penicillium capsulatum]|uniref:CFEM domain-containing protein n=1 Tax=Penicillium capsulatum TaxID=69766 RepID=A0A9W9HSY3_9EURO|nr:hypothetical protein N7492_008553 [Penicillium capsulatum]KAJ6105958.1 hypothetical protein N7512_009475 [Penicillium capsulatum]
MLLLPVYRIFAMALAFVVRCSASDSSLPRDNSKLDLSKQVPDCAQTCVDNFIKSHYTPEDCRTPDDVACLCRTKTASELTLGEAALSCVYALCPAKVVKSSKVYRMCDSVSGAQPETHATITATTFGTVRSTTTADVTTTSSTASITSENTPQAVITPATFTTATTGDAPVSTSVHSSSSEDGGPNTTDQSTASPSTTPLVSKKEDEKQAVSPATVIGVSVTSGVAGSFIIGVAMFFFCKRWKQRNQAASDASGSEQDFEIGGTMTEPPGFSQNSSQRSSPSPGPKPGLGPSAASARAHQEMSESPRAIHPTSQCPLQFASIADMPSSEQRKKERIGFAFSSLSDWESSPRTLTPQHIPATTMRDQTSELCPKPLKWSVRPVSGETLFEEDELQQTAAERRPTPQTSNSPTVMTGLPPNPRALKNGFPAQQFLRTPNQQQPGPGPSSTNPSERRLGPPFIYRNSTTSNSSSAPNCSSESSDHASSNTNLTTPPFTAQGRILSGATRGKPEPPQPLATIASSPEIVSRPRIVRRNDIKRVQIRASPRPPSEVIAPYCPEDLWLKRTGTPAVHSQLSSALPYPSEVSPGTVLYPSSPKKRPQDMPNRVSPTSRNLTPSRCGEDLILRVD